jgi:hypothetical protein
MLKTLDIRGVGPAALMEIEFAERINIITGDNGLGKSFILDIAWWALTRTWAGQPVMPAIGSQVEPSIHFKLEGKTKPVEDTCSYDPQLRSWRRKAGRPSNPGLVLYAKSDGGFAVWDPARNYWKQEGGKDKDFPSPDRPQAYIFLPQEVWDGYPLNSSNKQCNGLISDWATWQLQDGDAFAQLRRALEALSPSSNEQLVPGPLVRISSTDSRLYPTIRTPYGQDVPIVFASAGMKRILALAYLLVWSWQEHCLASAEAKDVPTHQIVFLFDEIESHLHPKWQRKIFASVLAVMDALIGDVAVEQVQVVAATHSPLVLASLESEFENGRDALFDLDIVQVDETSLQVQLKKMTWERLGTVDRWLKSDVFNLKHARSEKAETVIERVTQAMQGVPLDSAGAKQLDIALAGVLGESDPLWVQWRYFAEKKGLLPVEVFKGLGTDATN